MFVIDQQYKKEFKIEIVEFETTQIATLNSKQFEFNWNLEVENLIVALQLIKSKEILGLMSIKLFPEELRLEIKTLELSKNNVGEGKTYDRVAGILISYACKMSFQLGFIGFVSLIPKTRLITHYKNKYGFEQYGRHLAIDFERSEYLIDEYLLKK